MPYPVSTPVVAALAGRNRLTTLFRLVLALPHMLLVGVGSDNRGLLGLPVIVMAVISWFAILFTGRHPQGLRDFTLFYLRWRARARAYMALFTDQYPPFGDGDYPATLEVTPPAGPRDRLLVALRLLLALPHLVVLVLLRLGWVIVTVLAWFWILFTGRYPDSLLPFALGVYRWSFRVEAYLLLLVDEYPPFSLD